MNIRHNNQTTARRSPARHGTALRLTATTLAAAVLCPWAHAAGPEEDPSAAAPTVLATWNEGRITREELDSWRAYQFGDEVEAQGDPSEGELREIASWKILSELAEEGHLDESRRTRLHLELARQAVLVPLLRREVVSKVSVSDEEIEAIRREHPEAFRRPRKLKLRNIYKSFETDAEAPAVRLRMEEIHAALLAGADFEELAQEESDSQSAPRGGALGYVDPTELPPPVAAVVGSLSPGEISRPVEHGAGVSLFLCEEIREAQIPTPNEVRAKLRSQIERLRSKDAWQAYQEGLFEDAGARIDPRSSSAVLTMPGYRLDAEDLPVLATLRAPREGGDLGTDETERLLHTWALNVLADRRAVELGLDQSAGVAATLHWRRQEILARAELARRLQSAVPEPTEDELRRYFDEHRERYRQLAAYDLGVIQLGKPEGGKAGQALLETAASVARKIATGELTFEEAARRYSIHPSASAGGALGWRPKRQAVIWGPTARKAILHLQPGETTPLLNLDSGLWIFSLRDRRPARNLAFDEAHDQVEDAWIEDRLPAIEEAILQQVLEDAGFAIGSPAASRPRVIRWSTASEFENYGYHVYRGSTADGPFRRLTDQPIPGAGTTDVPHFYRYEDATAEPGTVYYYYVEAISTSGRARRLTPIRESRGEGS